MSLEEEVAEKRREIVTDNYAMSVSEFINLYRDAEVQIHPEFQRFFRWSTAQKSRLIESLLLSIPLPSIFVSQREDGVWDVVDGLQRLSTILEFVGDLKDEGGTLKPPTTLKGTKYLPSLEGATWDGDGDSALPRTLQLHLKRERLDFKIIKSQSDSDTKYDLFQRLNTAGSHLSDQELRNCVALMIDREFYVWTKDLQQNKDFQNSILMSDRQLDEQYDLELVLRYLALRNSDEKIATSFDDLGEFLTDAMVALAADPTLDREAELSVFERTFALLSLADEESPLRKYNAAKDKFQGAFSVSSFEVASVGVSENLELWEDLDEGDRAGALRAKLQEIWTNTTFLSGSGSGVRANTRVARLYEFTRTYMRP